MQLGCLTLVQAERLGLGLYQGAVVAIDVLVELDGDILVQPLLALIAVA